MGFFYFSHLHLLSLFGKHPFHLWGTFLYLISDYCSQHWAQRAHGWIGSLGRSVLDVGGVVRALCPEEVGQELLPLGAASTSWIPVLPRTLDSLSFPLSA